MSSLNFQPPPTYAEPVLVDEKTKKAQFNPIWLKWFVDLTQVMSAFASGSGAGINHNTLAGLQGGQTNEYYHLNAAAFTSLSGYTGTWAVNQGGTGAGTFTSGELLFGNGTGALLVDSGLSWDNTTKVLSVTNIKATAIGGYASSDGSTGITATITTASLVGKTITVKDGLITGFA